MDTMHDGIGYRGEVLRVGRVISGGRTERLASLMLRLGVAVVRRYGKGVQFHDSSSAGHSEISAVCATL